MQIDTTLQNGANSLNIKDKRIFYRKIMSNIMVKNEIRALELVNELMIKNLQAISREEELDCLRPWSFTLLEATETMGMTKMADALKEIPYITEK